MTLPKIDGFTEAEIASLSPEELAALQNSDGTEDSHLDDNPTGEADESAAAEAAEAAAQQAAANTDTSAAAANTDNANTDNTNTDEPDDGTAAPLYVASAPEDAQAQIDALKATKSTAKTEEKEAFKKLMDGDMTAEDYQAVKDKTDEAIESANDQIGELRHKLAKAEVAQEMSAQETARAWDTEVTTLMKTAKAEGIDYKANKELSDELNGLVRAFGQEATGRGMSDEGLKASKWALQQAHSLMKIRHPEIVIAKTPAKTVPQQTQQPRHSLTNLAVMPNADRPAIENETMARLGLLQGEALEIAMAQMSPAEVEKLMANT